jgi:dihydroorotase
MDLLVKGGKVFAGGRIQERDLWIKDGKIAALGGSFQAEEIIDARGRIVLPGAIDLHVHFRDPGHTYKEDWLSGSTSAAAGGVTTVVDQPNTDPGTLDRRSFELKLEIARRNSVVDFCINGGPGKIDQLVDLGVFAIGEIFTYEHSDDELYKMLREIEASQAIATIHAEDKALLDKYTRPLLALQDLKPDVYSSSRPNIVESAAIEKVLEMKTSGRIHICHLSTHQGLVQIQNAKLRGRKVTCEVAPHHLLFSRRNWWKMRSYLKTNPPVREVEDNDALWAGLQGGLIDVVASDHAPHLPEEKRDDIWNAPPGVPGVETMLSLMLLYVRRNFLTLDRMVDALSTRPARLFGLSSKGEIAVGKDADLVIIDPRSRTKIRADRLHSRAEWTPYEGMYAIFPKLTLVRGTVVFDEELSVGPGHGIHLSRPKKK